MTDKAIEAIINKLNKGDYSNIFLQRISENVEYGIAWHKVIQFHPLKGKYKKEIRDCFYLIKNEKSCYVGAVLVMEKLEDLHAFVKKEYRNQGYLTKAMTKSILPHLISKKGKQRITIDIDRLGERKYNISKKSALRIGFHQVSESDFNITRKDISMVETFQIVKYGMTIERVKQLSEKMDGLSDEISKIDDEFGMNLGNIPVLGKLKQILKEYGSHKLEDEYWKLKGNI
jgi:hypothetical protein